MGRTESTVVKPPAAFRRDARAKRARATINKVIPTLLSAHPRARRGIECSELIVDPPKSIEREQERKVVENDSPDDVKEGPQQKGHSTKGTKIPRLTLCVTDTLTAAKSLLDSSPAPGELSTQQQHKQHNTVKGTSHAPVAPVKVGILNMASPLSPGGGFLNGATSQEESLCMRTTLLPALRDEFYRLPELGVVYTPDVLVFRSASSLSPSSSAAIDAGGGGGGDDEKDILSKNDRWFVDVVSAAMLRLPEIEEDGRYASAADRELVQRKMRAVLRVFAAKGCTRVVLGAWGCGAYGNPVSEVAEAWRRVLVPDHRVEMNHRAGEEGTSSATARGKGKGYKGKKARNREKETWGAHIEDVVFAIKDAGMAAAFARAFGEDLLPVPISADGEHGSLSSTVGDEDEDLIEVARMGELRAKIEELELRLGQARSSHLKAGLETVLAGLRKQLPSEDDHEDNGENSDDDNDDEEQRITKDGDKVVDDEPGYKLDSNLNDIEDDI
ncbi:hypothetical protein HD806DRAFT_525514 [Xylariaceae sp. AK1471]|nr:hypothetical protein HD806DRAFT_525514 [Xylariaceae sp. AK1471]